MSGLWLALLFLAALVFLTIPLIIAQNRRSGRMTTRGEERLWRWYGRLDRRAAEGWRPPWRYPLAVGSTSLAWALAVWSVSHEVTFVIVGAVMGTVLSTMAVVTRRQAGGGNQDSRDR
jgi:hypothetical protein